ncbi:hypothetical protein B0186_07025 [Canicola haemoglobinophilus]|uniref:Starvation-inducible outer membrane lipoprotein n=1 Tax=Canicola haemoglobinophilus TaxID=733 RepID=A0A1V4B0R5_9PAST|nr:Slp family lipoprotein [Canicola haemoglobinophilus]OOS00110.1 hypothetical protein B0186_07025 [Canicola haemoglobinophilus]STO53778.1 starvation-inducible outer membrane lipoprotein [Canicola haemoglobinophilus]STO60791.1 starvation-inducible outer membrane lipoprotein [Canicola haemoglobinophilus]STO68311.1 starvation-inducible outer membrane lipoprotein [Canicola haemoglobinophilus]
MKNSFFLLSIFFLTACISAPQGLERDKYEIQNLAQVNEEILQCHCKQARLGGKVIKATALQNKMKIEVLSLPILTFSGRPELEGQTNGRFIAYLDGFIDPESLKDQYITMGGFLKGAEKGKIDQADYIYPILQGKDYRIWQLAQEYYYDPEDLADFYESRRRWGFGGFWRPEPRLRYVLY